MKKTALCQYTGLFLVMLFSGYLNLLQAQSSYDIKHKLEFTHCGRSVDPLVYADMVVLDYYVDGKQINPAGGGYTAGKHDLRVVLREKYPREGFERKFEIKEIRLLALNRNPARNRVAETHALFGKDVKIALTTAALSAEYTGYSMIITINRCDDGVQEYDANVKVVCTMITEAGGTPKPFPDMHIEIADRIIPVDEEGVGWFKLRPGQYTMSYRPEKNPDGAESVHPGAVTLRTSKTGTSQQLAAVPRKGNEQIQECRVPLLKENTGSGYLYDYELQINLLVKMTRKRIINEVRLVAVQPGVEVHKAGTPEDQWIQAKRDMVLQEGDEISCDPDGAATLQFADMSTTVVKNTTQLKIASYFTEGGVVKTEILLKMGEVAAQVHKSEATKSDFRIKSPTFTSSRRGTWYSHRYDPVTQTDIIKVEEGTVDIIPNNAATPVMTIRTGQQVESKNGSLGNIAPLKEKIDFSMPKPKPETKTETKPAIKPETGIQTKPATKPESQPETQPGNKTIPPVNAFAGSWQISRGTHAAVLTLEGTTAKLSGAIHWNNQKKGMIRNGSVREDRILFVVIYEDGSKFVYTATLDPDGKKMIDGTEVSPDGSTTGWTAVKK